MHLVHSGLELETVFTYTKPRTLLRIRREEENPNAFYMPCCKIKMNVSVENDITRQCQQDLDDKYGLKLPVYKVSDRTEQQEEKYDNAFYEQESLVFRNRSACYAQCILQKHNAADADGNVIPEKAVEFLKSIIPLTNDDFWGAVNDVCVPVRDDRPFVCKANSMLFKDCAHYMSDVNVFILIFLYCRNTSPLEFVT
ncbi:hypothetical protein ANN_17911 [Periplaneta americana]|uniref:Odorant-binding protein n=1 Tax=Periplaneta americana TaxID=6978 RepID=A0ABQ8SNE6_PERAM|nr:hypothetical protein ANN_17911 [Periplaneta americana]